jgi:hypothetical protein
MKTPSKAHNYILAALVAAALASCGDSKPPTAAEYKRYCETELGGDFSIMSTVDGDFGVCAVNHTPVDTEKLLS